MARHPPLLKSARRLFTASIARVRCSSSTGESITLARVFCPLLHPANNKNETEATPQLAMVIGLDSQLNHTTHCDSRWRAHLAYTSLASSTPRCSSGRVVGRSCSDLWNQGALST